MLYQLNENSLTFPPIDFALTDPNGLLAIGGDLQPQRLIHAYTQGIFPWFSDGEPLMWWSPDPRAIIDLSHLRINRTLQKIIKKTPYRITVNSDFKQVIQQCANAPFRRDGTWIVLQMQAAYLKLHQLGYAHSIEVWQTTKNDSLAPKQTLVGGLYGIAINGYFSGESMFYCQANASKFALVALGQLLSTIQVDFIDCQILNPFLSDMGASNVERSNFIKRKKSAINTKVPANFWQCRELYLS